MNDSSYRVAARHGLTAAQHYALRLIGQFGDAHLLSATDSDVAVVTLRSLHKRGLIQHYRASESTYRVPVGASDRWSHFQLTPEGQTLAERLGEWLP